MLIAGVILSSLPVLAQASHEIQPLEVGPFVLNEQDKALADRVNELLESSPAPEIKINSAMMEQSQAEAMQLYNEVMAKNPHLSNMTGKESNKNEGGGYTEHKILVFASLSLGEEGLKTVFESASGQKDVVVVFRGIPEGMNLGEGIMEVQNIAKHFSPIPNVIINPTLFQKHNVTTVPVIVALDAEQAALASMPTDKIDELARVSGLSDSNWIKREIQEGEKGDFGVKGPMVEILEPDMTEEAKRRVANIDWEEKKRLAQARFWTKQTFNTLPRAPRERIRQLDPSIYISEDITAPDGTIIAAKGDVINPLDIRPFTQAVVVYDPLDKKQVELVKAEVPALLQQPGVNRITYIGTQFDKEDGWKSYKDVTDVFNQPVYLLTPDIRSRFELEYTPSIITAAGRKFVIKELSETGQ